MSEILSQDQIDALLSSGGVSGESEASGGGSDGARNDGDRCSVLKTFFESFCEHAGSVISTVLSKTTRFSVNECSNANETNMQEAASESALVLQTNLSGGIKGSFFVIIRTKDVAILSDLMMMGDGSAEYTEDHNDAISELFNQVMGAFATEMGSKVGESVGTEGITVHAFDIGQLPVDVSEASVVTVGYEIEEIGDSSFQILVSHDFTEQLEPFLGVPEENAQMDSIGLNASELDDLSRVSDFSSDSKHFHETSFNGKTKTNSEGIEVLLDVELDVCIELGRSSMSIKRILELAPGSIVELDRMAGEPVDLMVNNKVVAKGEVVVVDESFGIRILSLVSPEERIRSLR